MPNSNHASFSTYSSRTSDSSQGTSTSTLFPAPPLPTSAPANGGPVEAANNVLNKRGDKEASLFMICLTLSRRLRTVPGFAEILREEEEAADQDTDPVTLLWRTFRKGYPLITIYNALEPEVRLDGDQGNVKADKKPQLATYKFLSACMKQLKFASEECFVLSDLYGDDTTGFVKVVRVVNRVLDILVKEGIIVNDMDAGDGGDSDTTTTTKRTQRQHIIDELVKTERTYVQHLELLQEFKKLVEEKGIVTGDAVHSIFLNLNALLDFQRRFLIRVEQTNAQPESEQNWGRLFVLYKEAFKVYEPFIANQKICEATAMAEFEKLKETGGPSELRQMVESPTHLTSFLLKPFQRLAKYPLLLKELRDKGDLDEERRDDISTGIEAASSVLKRTNEAVDLEDRKEALEELKSRVEDWKGHRIEGFGDLLLYGTFTVLKGDGSSGKDQEREYKIFLFEMILLCCKEINPNKQKNKLMSNKQLYDKRGKPKLQLKGRIFMQNVTDAISTAKPGSYTCQIFWKGDPGIENFVIRFTTEDTLKKWVHQVDTQRRQFKDAQRSSSTTKHSTTSATEFTYIKDQGPIENPYAELDEDDEVDVTEVTTGYPGQTDYTLAQGESTITGRARSATGESGVNPLDTSRPPHESASANNRAPPPRFPMGALQNPPLTLRTQALQAGHISPGSGGPMDSYFSPSIESPMSTRTSSSSDVPIPSQLKVKVHCPSAGSTMTLVVSTNISFQSLKDRIDAKLQRSTNVSLSSGQVKLKYLDEDDYVSIQSDEDVQMAFETWKEQQRDQLLAGQLGEIELFCQK
ncbi:hypothetical protein GTA08_BOTSDO11807 [Neofusicoccum parvum]|uniref:Uncharacterized protein n=1 Tax=Neofusicoccum parvum TaxID=310453 RepID=A0ACB5SJM6_9PEZI|nr:hypothetical protein GTA08_BOTSDO11807 [Neofusicoccum parvum]GME66178.1 hypothetical protein GTA08_BOTSDO11807 [Neofusicoccum parvum]